MTQIVMPGHTNGASGVLFGGVLMQWIDVCAGVAAIRHAGGAVVTASIDRLDFMVPVRLGDIVVLEAQVNFMHKSSMEVGCRVTLRGKRMYEFLDRLVNLALPRIRDFRGVNPKSFDGNGNYNMGLSEQMVFPEIDPDKVNFTQGMDITICTTASSDDEARDLLKAFDMPFRE